MLKRSTLLIVLAFSSAANAATILEKSVPRSWRSDYVDHFEAGYTAYGRTSYSPDSSPGVTGDILAIDAKLTAWARLFGNKQNLAEIRGVGYSKVDGTRDYDVEVWAWFGSRKVRLYEDHWNPGDGYIFLDESLDWTFFAAEQRFYGVVKVRGSVKGELGYSVVGTATNSFIGARLTPYVRAYARFTASVDAFVAEGGAYGELNLIKASVPIYERVALSSGCYSSEIDMDAKVTKLSGEAGVFYRLGWSSPQEKELWSWDGSESNTTLYTSPTITRCL